MWGARGRIGLHRGENSGMLGSWLGLCDLKEVLSTPIFSFLPVCNENVDFGNLQALM